jgi:hypothetical protein
LDKKVVIGTPQSLTAGLLASGMPGSPTRDGDMVGTVAAARAARGGGVSLIIKKIIKYIHLSSLVSRLCKMVNIQIYQ